MKLRFLPQVMIGLAAILMNTACASKATPTPANDMVVNIAMGVAVAETQTAEAPTLTPSVTPTYTPIPPTVTPTHGPIKPPVIVDFSSCWFGPGYSYVLESHIKGGKQVQLIGIGSIPGWYIIINPYYGQPCWIHASDVRIDANMDLSQIPLMTPIPLTPTPW
jgi:hypothetical protein